MWNFKDGILATQAYEKFDLIIGDFSVIMDLLTKHSVIYNLIG
ncbi:7226_t:CDS:2 [Dentiscutata heterogama]|uniref:7226_t:CDS:1 n=1 Tax=Dentiscutata heterogama TaxID=1316150 RepID=A0ACA9KKH9_9GLOM|nr:7226_t:CDS:2 [Dentiscutata heterogama]